tara:strand:- start:420 stop:521 length:102 start_codon:yes stop_codon:yes gene_type:complete
MKEHPMKEGLQQKRNTKASGDGMPFYTSWQVVM